MAEFVSAERTGLSPRHLPDRTGRVQAEIPISAALKQIGDTFYKETKTFPFLHYSVEKCSHKYNKDALFRLKDYFASETGW